MQAALFNDEVSGYDVLVASDAVGMGLNLNIRRIIFSSIYKFDGFERRMLTSSEAKQIAGKASGLALGRLFAVVSDNTGSARAFVVYLSILTFYGQ